MPLFQHVSQLEASPRQLYRYHCRPGAFARLTPPWEPVRLRGRDGGVEQGDTRELTVGWGPLRADWEALHVQFVEDRQLVDRQMRGPFKKWVHWHLFGPRDGGSTLTDRIEYEWPLGLPLGRLLHSKLERAFAYRHRQLARDLSLIDAYPGPLSRHGGPPLRVGITGASGLVGSRLTSFLSVAGHEVVPLVRGHEPETGGVLWWPEPDPAGLEGLDAVVHLAGESVAQLWTGRARERIYFSRVEGTRRLCRALADLEAPPATVISASAVGFYEQTGEQPVDESAPPGRGFLSEVCRDWEVATEPARLAGIRVCSLRIGLVVSGEGGFLAPQLRAFKLGLGAVLGEGRQMQSFVDIDDLVGSIYHLLNTPVEGPVNATAPTAVAQAELAESLARAYSKPLWLRVPETPLRILLRDQASVLLEGVEAKPARLLESGYRHLAPNLEQALSHHLGL